MAIEPLGSMMTYQAQVTPAAKPVKVEGIPSDGVDMAAQETGAQLDQTTAGVAKTQESSTDGQDSQGQSPAYSQAARTQEEQQQITNEKIKKAVEQFNKNANSEAVFGIHDKTNRVTIKIVDKKSKEVIKELPPEKTLDMIAKVWEMAGILVDEKR